MFLGRGRTVCIIPEATGSTALDGRGDGARIHVPGGDELSLARLITIDFCRKLPGRRCGRGILDDSGTHHRHRVIDGLHATN